MNDLSVGRIGWAVPVFEPVGHFGHASCRPSESGRSKAAKSPEFESRRYLRAVVDR